MSTKSGSRLSGHQQALGDYLASLLEEVPEYTPAEAPPEALPPAPVLERLPAMPLPPVAPAEPPAEPALPAAPVEAEAPAVTEPPAVTGTELSPAAAPAGEQAIPSWAEAPFPCLLFTVDGLNLAVPLVHLNGIQPWREELTPMPNHQPWYLGLARNQGVNTRVVDTALVVLPQERRQAMDDAGRQPFGNVILIDEARWGLACTAVGDMITLQPDDVRWRSQRGRRPWLAGTVIKEMCALLDTSALAEMLASGRRD